MVKVKADAKIRKKRLRREGQSDKHRHRARRFGVEYDPTITRVKLMERDDWTCGICWKPIANTLYIAEACADYGTIDHITPMAHGGPHTWANVRAAHNRCNWEAYAHLRHSVA